MIKLNLPREPHWITLAAGVRPNGLDIVWREDGWQRFRRELAQHPFVVEQKEAPAMGHLGHDEEVMA